MNVRIATKICFERYLNDFESTNDISDLIKQALKNIDTYPIDKLNRWLGYVQAYFIFSNKTTVDIERDFSRPLFHEAYKNEGYLIPESYSTKD